MDLDKVNFAKEYREKCTKKVTFVDGKSERNSYKFKILRLPILLNFLNKLNIFVNMYFMDKATQAGLGPLFELEAEKFDLAFVQALAETVIKQEKNYTCRTNSLCVTFEIKQGEQKLRCVLDCFNGSLTYKIPYPDFKVDIFAEPEAFLAQALSKVSVPVA